VLFRSRIDDKVTPEHLLWTLMFLKIYMPYRAFAALVGCDEKTFQKWTWCIIKSLSRQARVVVRVTRRGLLCIVFYYQSITDTTDFLHVHVQQMNTDSLGESE